MFCLRAVNPTAVNIFLVHSIVLAVDVIRHEFIHPVTGFLASFASVFTLRAIILYAIESHLRESQHIFPLPE